MTDSEYRQLQSGAGFFDVSLEGKIKVSGDKAREMLDGLVSNEINDDSYAAFLNKFGKVISDCYIHTIDGGFMINVPISAKNNVVKLLEDAASLSKCKVEDVTLHYALFSIQGKDSKEAITKIDNAKISNNKKIIITRKKRSLFDGFDVYVPVADYKSFKEFLTNNNIPELSNELYTQLRLEAHIPMLGVDFDSNNTISEVTEKAISYTKGCFVGQEIVARLKNIGKGAVPKKVVIIEIDSEQVPAAKTPVHHDDNGVGYVTSGVMVDAKTLCFAQLKKGYYDLGTELIIDGNQGNVIAYP